MVSAPKDVTSEEAATTVQPLVVGVTGHRDLVAKELTGIEALVRELLEDLAQRFPDRRLQVMSPLAEGADRTEESISNYGPVRGGGISMFPYNLEASGCPGTLDMNGELVFDGGATCVLDDLGDPTSEIPDDAVFAKAYVRYYDELRAHLQQWVCPIVGPDYCTSLDNNWLNGKDKLVKALEATIQPKVSAGAQNFGAVQSQLDNYQALLAESEFFAGPDPVNRLGEHAARVETLQHILNDKLMPSIPVSGFMEDDLTWSQ